MKKHILIFCEGITDQVFLADCLTLLYSDTKNINIDKKKNKKDKNRLDIVFESQFHIGEIIETGGCENLRKPIYLDLVRNNQTGHNLIIFDADEQGHGKGCFENTIRSLTDLKKNQNTEFDIHLWPNHNDNGAVENLLRQLIPSDKEAIFDCFEQYNNCIKRFEELQKIDESLKRSLNSYTYSFGHAKKESERDYKDNSFWEIDFEQKKDLKALKIFLDKYFS